ncbi:hypothetical protein [Nocardia sp. NPDC005825]|uniref:hypothetical protein n=1 Tax=unclassified Nocardia TaxID=2637762 RepID=UPI0033E3F42C
MARPSDQLIKVAINDLRGESGIWSQESGTMHGVSTKIAGLKFNRTEAGLFQGIVGKHDDIVDFSTDRTNEGATEFNNISTTLKAAADTYETEEQNNREQFENLW